MSIQGFSLEPNANATDASIRNTILENPGFGRHFTDHMAHIRWTEDAGFHGHQVRPYGPLSLDPAASVLPEDWREAIPLRLAELVRAWKDPLPPPAQNAT